MPQKRNLDGLEILRAQGKQVQSLQVMIKNISNGLISGYHRDTQLIKKPLIEGSAIVSDSILTALIYLKGLEPQEKRIREKISHDIFAADVANNLVQDQGLAFRDAYREANRHLKKMNIDIDQNLRSKISLGAPGNLQLDFYEQRIKGRNLYEKELSPLIPFPFSLEGKNCRACSKDLSGESWWLRWSFPFLLSCQHCGALSAYDRQENLLFLEA
jgi:hypothetical protein